jgi:hypothetical protein
LEDPDFCKDASISVGRETSPFADFKTYWFISPKGHERKSNTSQGNHISTWFPHTKLSYFEANEVNLHIFGQTQIIFQVQ